MEADRKSIQAGHFKREAKIMVFIALGVPLAAVGFFLAPWLVEFFAVDSCLDSGGRFNYESHLCEHRRIDATP